MDVIITIFKDQLADKPDLITQLTYLCQEVKELSDAILFIPEESSLSELISLLNSSKVSFGVHAMTEETIKIIREGE